MQDSGHEVTFVVPRALGLYARSLHLPAFSIGDGREMRVFKDERLYTTRFDGWSSWKQTLERYVAPTLESDLERTRVFFDQWKPDVVVTTGFAVAPRVAALARGCVHMSCTIYPQHLALQRRRHDNFPTGLMAELRRIVPPDLVARHRLTGLAWGGSGRSMLLHDRAVLGEDPPGGAVYVAGFPYWDQVPISQGELSEAMEWLDLSDDPLVVVTLGSFIGLRATERWHACLDEVMSVGARALLVGAKTARLSVERYGKNRVLTTAFLPLSQVLKSADAIVHHGGVGTTFAALRTATPSVVTPQAFDQGYCARLVAQSGTGVDARELGLRSGLLLVLESSTIQTRARTVRGALVNNSHAAEMAATWITTGGRHS
jgi:hypothetical protein